MKYQNFDCERQQKKKPSIKMNEKCFMICFPSRFFPLLYLSLLIVFFARLKESVRKRENETARDMRIQVIHHF